MSESKSKKHCWHTLAARTAPAISVAAIALAGGATDPEAVSGGQQDTTGHASEFPARFEAAMIKRRHLDDGIVRVRLLIFTRATHERDGLRVRVAAENHTAIAQERPACGCKGLWVVSSRTRRGRAVLRVLRSDLRTEGKTGFRAEVRGEGGGAVATFHIARYNRKFPPYAGTE